ncbi:TadE/TadG family type IV pilus assembly protein [Rhizobium sp. C4]|uniref:TadE/TadG family type IV pilus assembly protein n=1 Tax=Rhizobium sp. C4 TaxID=1349800 RepID=UPI001E370637|nr:TadE/TadG family type IV pilus assembly protein [Rhizobium sp. C4]MCD2174341.1 pilus assembly protein [Rhizobium sp. C4]
MPIMFAMLFGGLMLAAGGTIDIATIMRVRSNIQNVSDSAALAGASQYRLGNSDTNVVRQVALSFANSALSSAGIDGEPTVTVNDADRSVKVAIAAKVRLHFIRLGGSAGYSVNSNATARAGSSSVICLLALGDGSTNLGVDNGRVTASKCNTHSNSKSSDGLILNGLSTMSAKVNCTGGGYVGSDAAFDPKPATDCPAAADPLGSRPAPSDTKCDFKDYKVEIGLQTLHPGVYCGGLVIDKPSRVRLMHGTYIMKDGPLILTNGAMLNMVDAAVYLTGKDAVLYFDYTTTLDLSAPVSGPMAGILFFEDRGAPTGRLHQIGSRIAPQLLGTIYLSRGKLVVGQLPTDDVLQFDCKSQAANNANLLARNPALKGRLSSLVTVPCPMPPIHVSLQSAWTLIVARHVAINGGVDLVLNANYDAAPVAPPSEAMKDSTILVH